MSTSKRRERSETSASIPDHETLGHDEPQKEAQKSAHTVLEQHVQQAMEDIEKPARALLLSSLSAGLDLGFGPVLVVIIATLAHGTFSSAATDLMTAAAYTVGFVFVVLGRTTLFTEQTTSAVLPVLARRATVGQLLRLWALVLAGNLVGSALIAAFAAHLAPALGIVDPAAISKVAGKLLSHPWWATLFSAIAAGWLMGLLAWQVVASRDTISQIAVVVLTTFVIGIAHLHHSIAGSTEVLMAVFSSGSASIADYGRFLIWSVIGNAIGGSVFVALLKFGHVRASAQS